MHSVCLNKYPMSRIFTSCLSKNNFTFSSKSPFAEQLLPPLRLCSRNTLAAEETYELFQKLRPLGEFSFQETVNGGKCPRFRLLHFSSSDFPTHYNFPLPFLLVTCSADRVIGFERKSLTRSAGNKRVLDLPGVF